MEPMAGFDSHFETLPFVQSLSALDPISQFAEMNNNPCVFRSFHTFVPFSSENDTFLVHNQTQDFPGHLPDKFPGSFHQANQNSVPLSQPCVTAENESCSNETRKRKSMVVSESSVSWNSSSQSVFKSGIKRQNNSRRGKKLKNSDKEEEKQREVVHVRARRGQATDSHSLAERVRREKINERLRYLQDIVPGCYKTMGMATMLDEIINYVQSLQNQVEFLSMKLTAASTFYDFNKETDDLDTMQRAKAREAIDIGRQMKEANSSVLAGFHSSFF